MGKPRSYYRELRNDICVFGADTTLGWRAVKWVSPLRAAEKLGSGEWREVYDDVGNFVGCQVLARFQTDADLLSAESSPCYITATEARRNAGVHGKSRTLGLSEERRKTRTARFDTDKLLVPEDLIEKAIAKVAQWPFPASRGGDKAVRVYPTTRRHHNEPAIAVKGTA